MKLYLAGPMTGVEHFNFPLFNSVASQLREVGYKVINPAEVEMSMPIPDRIWKECLKRDIELLIHCDGIATLWDWGNSRGASLEVYIAKQLEIPVRPWDNWMKQGS